ncbi:MAG: HAD hydrolase family protein [Flavobacteriaceae bacterium]|nr:HAD hydrolase family protein [Flavobacteriaceae bacterium]MCY4216184.1 HAD hydrolase family protein [Flavobacteriaceae bacterium]MCY4254271.1 HAD hydrolase family protein [Flavobacteriaceae bacterium]
MLSEPDLIQRFKDINTFIFDMDGVLTDGKFIISHENKMLRLMHTRDGYGLRTAVMNNYKIIIISGSTNEESRKRLLDLGVHQVHLGIHRKLEKFRQINKDLQLDLEQVVYMGDDVPDIPLLKAVGLSSCPKDAVEDVLEIVDYVSPFVGGSGCVRDIIERVMRVQRTWKTTLWSQ